MSIQARIVGLVLGAILAAMLGFRLGLTVKQGEWDAAVVADAKGRGDALAAAAEKVAQIRVAHQVINQKVIHETVEVPVYRECVHPAGVRQSIDAALAGPAGGGVVPGSDPSGG